MSGRVVSSLYLDFQTIALYSCGNSDSNSLNWGKVLMGRQSIGECVVSREEESRCRGKCFLATDRVRK